MKLIEKISNRFSTLFNRNRPTKIMLTANDFQCLVTGEILVIKHKDGHETHIALQDIGFSNMRYLIGRAERESDEGIYIIKEREG